MSRNHNHLRPWTNCTQGPLTTRPSLFRTTTSKPHVSMKSWPILYIINIVSLYLPLTRFRNVVRRGSFWPEYSISHVSYLNTPISQGACFATQHLAFIPTRHLLFHNLHFLPPHLRAHLFLSRWGSPPFSLHLSTHFSQFMFVSLSSVPLPSPVPFSCCYCYTGWTTRALSRNIFVREPRLQCEGSCLINYTNVETLIPANALSALSSRW